ncbi:nucleotide disphospho-sugar-binding domain-containing protein [Streptomyces sp. NPDC051561]|uniref:nucleotide disphospho-sugar-binding domain-containing protein n=1 Tax=Streptomyces sp. NPDC051561 TaxID=3365658 RepID=UPI0037A9BC73
MRVLITLWPNPSHLYADIPVAWALQGAGHEVRIASHPDLAEAVTAAGLTAVSLGTAATMPSLDLDTYASAALDEDHRSRLRDTLGVRAADGFAAQQAWEVYSTYHLIATRILHPAGVVPSDPAPATDALVEYARHWQPDLVLWEPTWPGAAIAARAAGAAHARLLWGLDVGAWASDRFAAHRAELSAAGLEDPLTEVLRPVAERYGQQIDDELLYGQWTVDTTPPEMQLRTSARTVEVRRVPYTGVGVVPEWLHPAPSRPRVALSLGVSVREHRNDNSLIDHMLQALGGLDIDVVATLNDEQLAGVTVPDNVRTLGFLPLNQLLPTCDAVIHHGGGGTTAAAVAHRVPQLVVEGGGGLEAWAYADWLTAAGAGVTLNHEKQSVEQIRAEIHRVLTAPGFRAGAHRLHADWLSRPSPNDVVPALEQLTAQHRR